MHIHQRTRLARLARKRAVTPRPVIDRPPLMVHVVIDEVQVTQHTGGLFPIGPQNLNLSIRVLASDATALKVFWQNLQPFQQHPRMRMWLEPVLPKEQR